MQLLRETEVQRESVVVKVEHLPGLGCKNSLVFVIDMSIACTVRSVFYNNNDS